MPLKLPTLPFNQALRIAEKLDNIKAYLPQIAAILASEHFPAKDTRTNELINGDLGMAIFHIEQAFALLCIQAESMKDLAKDERG